MTIDFSKIEIFTDVAHTVCDICDLRTQFADIIYNLGRGIECHALAFKIYNSDGLTHYDEREVELIDKYSKMCSPAFIDAIERVFNRNAK